MEGLSAIQGIGRDGTVLWSPDKAKHVEFYMHAELQGYASQQAGRPIHKDTPYIRIVLPEGKSVVCRRVKEEDKIEYKTQWTAFEATGRNQTVGTKLENWGVLDNAQVADLVAQRVYTVDQLASLSDTNLQALGPGATDLRTRARKWLSAITGETDKQLEAQKELILSLQEKIAALEARVNQSEMEQIGVPEEQVEAKKRGRPKKIIINQEI